MNIIRILTTAIVFGLCSQHGLAEAQHSNEGIASPPPALPVASEITVPTSDGRTLSYFVDRVSDNRMPALIVIDGSGCVGARRDGFLQLMAPDFNPNLNYARIVVAKTGVPHSKMDSADCSTDFMQHYAMDDRLIDHMRVMQHIRQTAEWWDGRFMIYGWSDGGDIATQLFAYSPDATRLAFGGVGGGYMMADHFRHFWVCPEGTADRHKCISALDEQFEEMMSNPSSQKSWSGEDNSYKAWESRLDTRLSPLLTEEVRPVLIIHGADDFDASPVQSARKLAEDIAVEAKDNLTYWEIEGMGHDMWSLPPDEALMLENCVLDWLVNQSSYSITVDQCPSAGG